MTIALVHDFLTQWGGGEYILKVFTEIFPEAPIFLINYDPKIAKEHFPDKKITASFLQNWPGMPKKFKWYLPLMPRAIESLDVRGFDIVLSDCSAYSKGVITDELQKHICYLHTPTRYLWSDREEYLESAPIPGIIRPIMPPVIKYLQKWDLKAAKRPDILIANSNYIAQRTRKYYHRDPEYVIFPPIDTTRFFLSQKKSDYFLSFCRHEPYKRTDLIIKAANKLRLKLKVAGGGSQIEKLKSMAGPTVEFLGRVSDDQLEKLYSQALAYIFPAKEDAGITPLEAMASGCPVIAYGVGGSLESVIPGKTGLLFPHQSEESLIKALKSFRSELFQPTTIRQHAQSFDVVPFKEKIKTIVSQSLT